MVAVYLLAIAVGSGAFAMANGMSDLSALMATLTATRALSLTRARVLAIVGVWLGILWGSDAVARTVAVDLAHLQGLSPVTALRVWTGAIFGSVAWVNLARKLGIPTSATHTFVGALCGSVLAGTWQPTLVNWGLTQLLADDHRIEGVMRVFAGLILSPLVGAGLGFLVYRLLAVTLQWATPEVNLRLRRLESLAVFTQSLTYGLNDAHGVMGILTGACISAGVVSIHEAFYVPLPIKAGIALALTFGAVKGSLNILSMMGRGLLHVYPAEALAGQVASAAAVLGAGLFGAPVSSSQVTSSALIGVGGAWRPRHVRWKKVRDILMTWVVTFPSALVVGGAITLVIGLL